jgi:hypothetical protein
MKSIFASLIVALFAVSVLGKDGHCIFRVHVEANANDTATFSSSMPALFSGKRVAIEWTVVELQIDRRVTEGRVYVASGLSEANIDALKPCWRLSGEKKKR